MNTQIFKVYDAAVPCVPLCNSSNKRFAGGFLFKITSIYEKNEEKYTIALHRNLTHEFKGLNVFLALYTPNRSRYGVVLRGVKVLANIILSPAETRDYKYM